MHDLEYSTPEDLYYDFCLWEYKASHVLRQQAQVFKPFFDSFEFTGAEERIADLMSAIRQEFGVYTQKHGLGTEEDRRCHSLGVLRLRLQEGGTGALHNEAAPAILGLCPRVR